MHSCVGRKLRNCSLLIKDEFLSDQDLIVAYEVGFMASLSYFPWDEFNYSSTNNVMNQLQLTFHIKRQLDPWMFLVYDFTRIRCMFRNFRNKVNQTLLLSFREYLAFLRSKYLSLLRTLSFSKFFVMNIFNLRAPGISNSQLIASNLTIGSTNQLNSNFSSGISKPQMNHSNINMKKNPDYDANQTTKRSNNKFNIKDNEPLKNTKFNEDQYGTNKSNSFKNDMPYCPNRGMYFDSFEFRWFFNNWKESNFWHDTEVLLAESTHQAIIVFRGSDSAADFVTNSQTMEPAVHSKYFHNCYEGSIHRGIFNAYSKVHKGTITSLYNNNTPSAFGESIPRAFKACLDLNNKSYHEDLHKGNDLKIGLTCEIKHLSLSELLINASLSALQSGKKLIISGHSLGGALSLLLSFDLILNHYDKPKSLITTTKHKVNDTNLIKLYYNSINNYVYKIKDWIKNKFHFNNMNLNLNNSSNHHNQLEKKLLPIQNIYLYTFGEPEVVDGIFYDQLYSSSPSIQDFIRYRYKRFISLTKSPLCKPDIVTRISSRIALVLGEVVIGHGGGKAGRMKRKQSKKEKNEKENNKYIKKKKKQKMNVFNEDMNISNTNILPPNDLNITKSMSLVSNISSGSNNNMSDLSNNTKIDNNDDKVNVNNNSNNRSNKSIDVSSTQKPEHKNNTLLQSPLSHIATHVTDPIYVCSGSANNSFEAHFMLHYLRGLACVGSHRKWKDFSFFGSPSSINNLSIACNIGSYFARELGFLNDEFFHWRSDEVFSFFC